MNSCLIKVITALAKEYTLLHILDKCGNIRRIRPTYRLWVSPSTRCSLCVNLQSTDNCCSTCRASLTTHPRIASNRWEVMQAYTTSKSPSKLKRSALSLHILVTTGYCMSVLAQQLIVLLLLNASLHRISCWEHAAVNTCIMIIQDSTLWIFLDLELSTFKSIRTSSSPLGNFQP
jgi:hypothetical protein